MAPDSAVNPDSTARQCRRLRLVGITVLVLGLGGAGLVHWMGIRALDSGGMDYAKAQTRAESRQMGILYGKMGQMAEDFTEALKRPDTWAGTLAVVSALGGLGCIYLARASDEGRERNSAPAAPGQSR